MYTGVSQYPKTDRSREMYFKRKPPYPEAITAPLISLRSQYHWSRFIAVSVLYCSSLLSTFANQKILAITFRYLYYSSPAGILCHYIYRTQRYIYVSALRYVYRSSPIMQRSCCAYRASPILLRTVIKTSESYAIHPARRIQLCDCPKERKKEK